jgi:TRAP-type mannitol/chloroaromatic compound transport system permease small subunit
MFLYNVNYERKIMMFNNDLIIAMLFFVVGGLLYLIFLKSEKNPFSHDSGHQGSNPSNYFGMWGVVIMCMIMFIFYLGKWLS